MRKVLSSSLGKNRKVPGDWRVISFGGEFPMCLKSLFSLGNPERQMFWVAFDEFVVWLVDVATSQVEWELSAFLVEVMYAHF